MAVVGVAQEAIGSPFGLRFSQSGLSLKRRHLVWTDTRQDGPLTAAGAIGLPQVGQVYQTANEFHPLLFCRDVSLDRKNSKGRVWVWESDYRTPDPNRREEEKPNYDNPEFELPEISDGSIAEMVDIKKDAEDEDRLFRNSAGYPFLPQPKVEAFWPTLTITRNETIYQNFMAKKLFYQGRVASDSFWGFAPLTARCLRVESTLQTRVVPNTEGRVKQAFLRATYEFMFKESWKHEELDQGYYYRTGTSPNYKYHPIRTEDGSEPLLWNLNGSGGKGTPEDPVFLLFDIHKRAPFAALNLPQSYLAAVYLG